MAPPTIAQEDPPAADPTPPAATPAPDAPAESEDPSSPDDPQADRVQPADPDPERTATRRTGPARGNGKPNPRGRKTEAPVREPEPVVSPAEAFIDRFKAALIHEVEVQKFERMQLGSEDIERLNRFQLQRRERIDADMLSFPPAFNKLWFTAVVVPEPQEGEQLNAAELVALQQIEGAYAQTRDLTLVNRLIENNGRFLDTSDWNKRKIAVDIRDELLEREASFQHLQGLAEMIARGNASPERLVEVRETLMRIAPHATDDGSSLALLVLEDEDVRRSVLADVIGYMLAEVPPQVTLTSDELEAKVLVLQTEVAEQSGLADDLQELQEVEQQVKLLEQEAEDDLSFDFERRKARNSKLVELYDRRNELRSLWRNTEPAVEPVDELIATYDELIRTRMAGLGLRGALFGARFDALDRHRERRGGSPIHTWNLLDDQNALLNAIGETEAEPDYLEGLPPPPDKTSWAAAQEAASRDAKARTQALNALKKKLGTAPKKPSVKGNKTFFSGGTKGGGGGSSGGKKKAGGKKKKGGKGR